MTLSPEAVGVFVVLGLDGGVDAVVIYIGFSFLIVYTSAALGTFHTSSGVISPQSRILNRSTDVARRAESMNNAAPV